jgi:hypothetical protein
LKELSIIEPHIVKRSGVDNNLTTGVILKRCLIKPEVFNSNIPGNIKGQAGNARLMKPEASKSNIPGNIRGIA